MAGIPPGEGRRPVALRDRRRDAARRELLLTARKLFGEAGLDAVVPEGAFDVHFDGKNALVRAVVADCFEELQASMLDARVSRPLGDLVAGIVEAHLRFFDANPDARRVLHQARGLTKAERPLRRSLDLHLDRLAALLASGARPSLPRERSRELAVLLFGALSGFSSVRLASDPRAVLASSSADVVHALVAAALAYTVRGRTGSARKTGVFGRVGAKKRAVRRRN